MKNYPELKIGFARSAFLALVATVAASSGRPAFADTLAIGIFPPGSGTVSPSYSKRVLQDGKTYTATAKAAKGFQFTDWTGDTNWTSAKLTFVMRPGLSFTANFQDIQRPTCVVLFPKVKQAVGASIITVSGRAADNVGVTAVYFQLNTGDWLPATGAANWSAPGLVPVPGANVIRVFAVDAAGNRSLTNSIAFMSIFEQTVSVGIFPPGAGATVPNYNDRALQQGKTYAVTAKAAKGFQFTAWTGDTNSTSARLSFVMRPGLSFTANFQDVQRPACVVRFPKVRQIVGAPVITAMGRASDNGGVTAVYFQLNAGDWLEAMGTTNWSAPGLMPVPGANVIRAFAVDAAGNPSLTNSIAFTYALQYTGIYLGEKADDPSGPGGFALFVDAAQKALVIGGDPYNDDSGNPVYGACPVDADGQGSASDPKAGTTSFTIHSDGSVDLAVDTGGWHWEITGNLVTGGHFRSAAGAYSATVSGQSLQGILSPDGWFYSSSPTHGGGARCQFAAYEQPVTQVALGHAISTLTLHSNGTISATGDKAAFTFKRVDPLP